MFSIWQSDIILDAPSVWGYLLFHFADVWSTVRHRPEDAGGFASGHLSSSCA